MSEASREPGGEERERLREKARRKGPLAWFARNPVVANALLLALVLGGLLVGGTLTQEVFPDFTLGRVVVDVQYPGASPEDVEQGVLLALEEEVRGLDGVKEVRALADEGFGRVTVELLRGAQEDQVLSDVKSAVSRITSFPEEIEEPTTYLASTRRRAVSLVLHGDAREDALRGLAEQARRRLLADERITLVELSGVRPLEISIEVPEVNLRRHGLTLPQIAARVRQGSVDVPAGEVEAPRGELLVRTDTRRRGGEEFANIVLLAREDGTVVRVKDVATVHDGYRDVDQAVFFNGQPAVLVDVFRVGEQTPLEVSAAVREMAEELRESLPPGLSVAIWQDRAELYDSRIRLLLENGLIGLLLIILVLGLFLQPRLAFWVMLGMPVSFIGALLVMGALGVSINMISLFAFILVLGLVIDDAIIVGESTFHRRQQGMERAEAAIVGVREVVFPVTFAVVTTMLAFAPLLFVPGFAGKIFRNIPLIVLPVLAISLVESFFILPAHLAHTREGSQRGVFGWLNRQQQRFTRGVDRFVERFFLPTVRRATHRRYLTLTLFLVILACTLALFVGRRIRFTFLPAIEVERTSVLLEMPVGTPLEVTRRANEALVEAARQTLEEYEGGVEGNSEGILAYLGLAGFAGGGGAGERMPQGGHVAQVVVALVRADERPFSAEAFTRRWRERVGSLPGVERLSFNFEAAGSSAPPIAFELSHPDQEVLREAASELARRIQQYEGVFDVDDGFVPGKEQLSLSLKPEGKALGLTPAELASQVRGAFYGAEALRQQRGRYEVRVYVRLPESQQRTEQDVYSFMLLTPGGGQVPLATVADVRWGRAYSQLQRVKGQRIAPVTADVDRAVANANEVVSQVTSRELPELRERYPGLTWSFGGEQEQQRETVGSLATLFALALALIYALLTVALRSFVLPCIILAAIPFGLVGAVVGHLLLGYNLSVISLMGVVALAGVVVNDSLLLLLTLQDYRRQGRGVREATRQASARRFRPILLTTLTTFLGLAPIMFETGAQARFLIPMAISLGFGILFATVITLFLVPSLYLSLEDVKRGARYVREEARRRRREGEERSTPEAAGR